MKVKEIGCAQGVNLPSEDKSTSNHILVYFPELLTSLVLLVEFRSLL